MYYTRACPVSILLQGLIGSKGTSGFIVSSMGVARSCTEQVVFSESRLLLQFLLFLDSYHLFLVHSISQVQHPCSLSKPGLNNYEQPL